MLISLVVVAALAQGSGTVWTQHDRNRPAPKVVDPGTAGTQDHPGIYLVVQVVTDDALNAAVDDAVAAVREQAAAQGITFTSAQRLSSTSFSMEGVKPASVKGARTLLEDFFRGWEVRQPGQGRFLVQMPEVFIKDLRQKTVEQAIRILEQRMKQLGVAEPVIGRTVSQDDEILVQLAGVKDVEQAKRLIRTTGQLMLKLVEGEPAESREALLERTGGKIPEMMEIVQGRGDTPGPPAYYLVGREAIITGRDLKDTRVSQDVNYQPAVDFTLTPAAADRFKLETAHNVGRRLAIILDGIVTTAPLIIGQISGEGQISGHFTTQEADELAKVLRAGALPATLRFLEEKSLGATQVRDSVRSGVLALAGRTPADAVVLFDGKDLARWRSQKDAGPARWKVENGYFEVAKGTGGIETAQPFGDCQLHLEWASPLPAVGEDQDRGNSGVFFMGGRYELQILDSYQNVTYADGQAGSVFGQNPPLVNPSLPPGQWQAYDVVFHGPRFDPAGKLLQPARITAFLNGVLIQDGFELSGPTAHQARPPYVAHASRLPIGLQDHSHPVRFRNVWVRELGEGN